jgi:hypothetical protein
MTDTRHISIEGGCTCGVTRYRLTARPLFVHCCHCTWCQRETGSAFAVNALIEASRVELPQGDIALVTLPSPSGNGQVFARCRDCGITLWSYYAAAREKIAFIRTGTLDDPAAFPPDIHIYTSTRRPWVTLPGGVPAVPEYYRRSEYWPDDSIARCSAATAAGP